MDTIQPETVEQNERLAIMVERCLDSPSAYRLFAILGSVSKLGLRVKLEFLDLARDAGGHSKQEMDAIARLTLSGAAQDFKAVVDQVCDEQVKREGAAIAGDPPVKNHR